LDLGGHGESGKIKVESGKLWNPDVGGMGGLIWGFWAVGRSTEGRRQETGDRRWISGAPGEEISD